MPLIAVAVAFFLAMSNLTGILRGAEVRCVAAGACVRRRPAASPIAAFSARRRNAAGAETPVRTWCVRRAPSPTPPPLPPTLLQSFAVPDGGERTTGVVAMQLLQHVLILLALAVVVLAFVFKNGRRFVNAPQLKPEAARPW